MVDVERDWDKQEAVLKTDKRNTVFTLYKDKYGYGFLFKVSEANVPKELSGRYSSIEKGIECFKNYELTIKESHAARSDRLAKLREERRAQPDPKDS